MVLQSGDEVHLGFLTPDLTFWLAHCTKKKEGLLVTVDGLSQGA